MAVTDTRPKKYKDDDEHNRTGKKADKPRYRHRLWWNEGETHCIVEAAPQKGIDRTDCALCIRWTGGVADRYIPDRCLLGIKIGCAGIGADINRNIRLAGQEDNREYEGKYGSDTRHD